TLRTSTSGKGLLRLIPNWTLGGQHKSDFKGQGNTSRSGKLEAQVTARVVKVYDSGNLLIQGSKIVEINQEKEVLMVTGIVRPEDIMSDNMINSSKLADAKIVYSGRGVTNDAQRPGIVTRIFNYLF
ncbi:MAG: flagellar basal body L-ring protein FlgH, partial [bacterium]